MRKWGAVTICTFSVQRRQALTRLVQIVNVPVFLATAEIVDRIAATVGTEVITESQVLDELRVTAFIEGATPEFSAENNRKVVDRLIDQALVHREIEFTRFDKPSPAEIEPLFQQIRGRFPTESAYQQELRKYHIKHELLLAHLTWQVTMLRFIEYRFQPSVQVGNSELRQEYRRQAADWRAKRGTEPPPLEQIQPDIEKIVRQRLTDSALDRWLGAVRTQNVILYREGYR